MFIDHSNLLPVVDSLGMPQPDLLVGKTYRVINVPDKNIIASL